MAKQLVIDNPEYSKRANSGLPMGDIEPSYTLYKKFEQNGKVFYRVPRYALGNYSELINKYPQLVKGYSEAKESIEFNDSSIEFNDSQKSTIEKTVEMLNKELGAIIVASPAEGKTTCAIKIASILGMKTLVLVHKDFLAEQWKENILKCTNIKENEIGLLKQGKFIDGKIVIGSMQSLMRGTIDNAVNDMFGLVILDECHRVGCKMFLRSATRFNSKFRLGLSATPDREDKLERLYYYHLSSNLVIHNNVRNMGSDFYVIEYERETSWKWYPSYIPFKIQLIHNIVADEVRNRIIIDAIVTLRKKGRKILVLSERISHLMELMNVTKKLLPNDCLVRFFGAKSLTKKERIAKMKQEKVKDPTSIELLKGDVIFGTYSKVKEGVDIPQLDTLIFATPLSSKTTIIQAKGRPERLAEGKKKPVVIDIYDTDKALLIGMYKKRERLYKELNMHRILLFDDIK
ncbi:MAG: DEAD/DEAH box helicase family protein [Candidatus Paceibacterota bacterium]